LPWRSGLGRRRLNVSCLRSDHSAIESAGALTGCGAGRQRRRSEGPSTLRCGRYENCAGSALSQITGRFPLAPSRLFRKWCVAETHRGRATLSRIAIQRSKIGEPSLPRGGFSTLAFNTQWRITMARDEHNKAAEHHENAAKSHRAAAEHHGKGDHAKAKEHSSSAQQHSQNARQHSEQAHSKSQQQK
jgi:hypothetical protein